MSIAENIGRRRVAARLTQQEAADRAGIAQGHWSEYETGKRKPTVETLYRLAEVLGVRAADLID